MDASIEQVLELLDHPAPDTVGTSVRVPVQLRDAAALAIKLGWGESATKLTVKGLRAVLEALAQRAILDAHYEVRPGSRPDLAEVALATAAMDGNPLALRPGVVRRAAYGIGRVKEDASADEVLAYAAALTAAVM